MHGSEWWRVFWAEGGELRGRVSQLADLQDYASAERLIKTAMAERGVRPQHYVLLAEVYTRWGKNDKAEETLLQGVSLFSHPPQVACMLRLLLARLYAERECWQLSARVLVPVLKCGTVLSETGLYDDVVRIFCSVLRLLDQEHMRELTREIEKENPLELPPRVVYELLRCSRDSRLAVAWHNKVQSFHGTEHGGVGYHFLMGLLSEHRWNHRDAIGHYLLAYRLSRRKGKKNLMRLVAVKLSLRYLTIGRWECALRWAEPVVLNGQNDRLRFVALLAMGIASFGKKRYVTARRYFEEALNSGHGSPAIACRWLFRALIKLNPASAVLFLSRVLQKRQQGALDGYPVEFLLCHFALAFAHMGLRNEAVGVLTLAEEAASRHGPLFRVYRGMLEGRFPDVREIRTLCDRRWRQFVREECRFTVIK